MRPDPDQLQQWVLHDRVPAAEIGSRLGLSRAAVYGWLRRYGVAAGVAFLPQDRLIGLWRAGMLASRIATETGLPLDAVRERLVTAAVLVPDRSYFVVGSPEDPLPEHLLRDWVVREGFTAAQVATLTGTTPRQVRYRLDRYRLSTGRPGPAPRLRRLLTREKLVTLYQEQALSCPQIARGAGVSAEAVRELLVEYGIDRRRSGSRSRPPLDPAALDDYRGGAVTLQQLAVRLGYVTAAGNPAVRRLRAALQETEAARPAVPLQRQHRYQATLDRAGAAIARSAELIASARETVARLKAT
jgi:transposase